MKSESELFLHILSVFTVFLSLLWVFARSSLWVADGIATGKIVATNLWRILVYLVPILTIAMLLAMIGCTIACLNDHEQYKLGWNIMALYIGLILLGIITAFGIVSFVVRNEFVIALDRQGN